MLDLIIDLHELLKESLPEEIWNPEDVTNSAMALDCITTVSEDFLQEMINLDGFQWKVPFCFKNIWNCLSINSDYKFGINLDQKNYRQDFLHKVFA